MHYSCFYPRNLSEEDMAERVVMDGFRPQKIINDPHYVYDLHSHPETKEIVCLKGSMMVDIDGHKFPFLPGDKIVIPGNTPHSAVVGDAGCTYLWSEKI